MPDIVLQHKIDDEKYRMPLGAVPTSSNLSLRLDVNCPEVDITAVRLYYAYGLKQFASGFIAMECIYSDQKQSFFKESIRMDDAAGLFYYWFEIRLKDGRYRWCFPDPEHSYLSGKTLVESPAFSLNGDEKIPAFQVTVYDSDFYTPDWMKGAVVYQIFPDRFYRGKDFNLDNIAPYLKREERIWHNNWLDEVDIAGKEEREYEATDFFGGTLQGIKEKLPYIASFGTKCIYLNPIFEARSNHRYDTGDYFKIDPLLGDESDFRDLCREAEKYDISIILDGVFSHSGADSIYFNKFNNYPSIGAWQEITEGKISKYSSWYHFIIEDSEQEVEKDNRDIKYKCWWGFDNLPDINEKDLSYKEFITGDAGVLAYWLEAGCRGFRLDVADELPDSFLRSLRKRVKAEKDDAYIVGEVWEDPSAKISYGSHRDFIFGRSLDASTNYPFRECLFSWLLHNISTQKCVDKLNYQLLLLPREAAYCMLNPLGSHDVERAVNVLANVATPAEREQQKERILSREERDLAEKRLLLALIALLAYPGAAHIYYGDEKAMEGFKDPFNRRSYNWQEEEKEITNLFRELLSMRRRYAVLRTGLVDIQAISADVLFIKRYFEEDQETHLFYDAFNKVASGEKSITFLINRSDKESMSMKLLHGKKLEPLSAAIIMRDEINYYSLSY